MNETEIAANVDQTRVLKTSLHRLVKDEHKNCLIKAIDKLVLFNSKIAVRGSIILNYYVAKCSEEGMELPTINPGFLYRAFNWNHSTALSELLPEIRNIIPDPITIHDEQMEGKSWLIGYLIKLYMANIKSSIKNRYNSVIKHSIKGHIKAHHPNATKNKASSLTTNLIRCIWQPIAETMMEYTKLDDNAKDLVQFHRGGFEVDNDGYINDYFIDDIIKQPTKMTQVIMHFSNCLKRQHLLETEHLDGANMLKKQNALPQFSIGVCNSIFICKRGMR